MDFSEALERLKDGCRVYRKGEWRYSFIYYVSGSEFVVNRAPLNEIFEPGTQVTYRPHIDMRGDDGRCGVWTPTHEYILAEDWEVCD